jgi:hypothetical protein
MKILHIYKAGTEKYRIKYKPFFGRPRYRYAFMSSPFYVDFSWLDSGKYVGIEINSILKWMHRNNIEENDYK